MVDGQGFSGAVRDAPWWVFARPRARERGRRERGEDGSATTFEERESNDGEVDGDEDRRWC